MSRNAMQRYIANLGTDMLTNPISCSTAHRHAWILWQLTLQTCMQTCLQTLQLFNCAIKCMDPTAIHIANIGTDMPTNLTTVQLYMNSMAIRIVNLGADMLTNPIGCSIVHKNAWILWQITLQTLAQTCLQTLQLFSCTKDAWILHQLTLQTLAQTCLQTLPVAQLCLKCMDSMAIHTANLGADMLTNPISCSIARKMHGFYNNIANLGTDNAWILWQFPWQTLAQTCLQTLQLFYCM